MRVWGPRVLRTAAAAIIGAALAAVPATGQGPDADLLRDKLDAYLLAYEPRLGELVAEELLVQRDGPSRDAIRFTALPVQNRRLVSEVAFISLPGNAGWLGFRRTTTLNGKALPDAGPSLAILLTDDARDDFEQARLLLLESARLNLGMPRTTNLPNLPLEFLHPRHRRRFTHRVDGRQAIRGVETTRMVFTETASPSIIQRPEGGDMPSEVMAWVETSSGRLIRANVKTRDARIGVTPFDAEVRVEFQEEPSLGLLVPVEMREEFFAGRFREGTGVAKYSKYRKFRTASRVVPPGAP